MQLGTMQLHKCHHCSCRLHARQQQRLRCRPSPTAETVFRRGCVCTATGEGSSGNNATPPRSRPRRERLFQGDGHSKAAAEAANAGNADRRAVADEFAKVFEAMGVEPTRVSRTAGENTAQTSRWPASNSTSTSYGYDSNIDDNRSARQRSHRQRTSVAASSSNRGSSSSSYLTRGKTNSDKRQQWVQDAIERQLLEQQEQLRKQRAHERSSRIPQAPKPSQDPVIFQAITRDWDEKATKEERRGARAAARWTSRIAIQDRNKSLKKIRKKVINEVKRAEQKGNSAAVDPELLALAQRAAQQIEQAAKSSIQPAKEVLYQQAAGVKRSFERAQALPEGEWDRLKHQYRSDVASIKIGRKGASPSLISQMQDVWRRAEVVKLVIHDDKSARKVNLPRLNLLLKELEERSGGVLIDQAGSSIWLYRGLNYTPPPPKPVYKPPPAADLFVEQYAPLGQWQDIAGISCYVVSSRASSSSSSSSEASESRGNGSTSSSSEQDAMTVLFLPDQFSLADSMLLLQAADKVALKGALVIMPDLLGLPASDSRSSFAQQAPTSAGKGSSYWLTHRWPLVKKRKLEYFEWHRSGAGSWSQQRPRLLQLLEEMQNMGLYDKHAAKAVTADADSASTISSIGPAGQAESSSTSSNSSQLQQQQQQQPSQQASSSSNRTAGRPLGVLGLGWGTYIGFRAAGDSDCFAAGINCVAALSPVTYYDDADLANALKLPIALLPAKYDPMEQFMITVNLLARSYASRCIFKRFGKVKPGWAHWLPQWIDKRAMFQAAEQLLLAVAFLQRELLGGGDAALLSQAITGTDPAAAGAPAVGGGGAESGGCEQADGADSDTE